jgi:hypothetical protein
LDIEKAIENHVKTNVTLIKNRIYPDLIPETTKEFPAMAYSLISGVDDHALGTDPDSTEERWQFTIETKSVSERAAVYKQLKAAFRDFTGTMGGTGGKTIQSVLQVNRTDFYDSGTGIYQRMVDFMFIYDDI